MEALALAATLTRWNAWANAAALEALRAAAAPPAEAARVAAHLAGAEHLWLARIRAERAPLAVWPALDLERTAQELARLATLWAGLFAELAPADLTREVRYVNSKGEPWTSTLGDVLLHVPTHSHYHRGQIAQALRRAGCEPAYTDLIHALRSGFVG
jgi:uncharacterized damage-inducible protein DinB